MENRQNVRIGDILKEYGHITDTQLEAGLEYQKRNKGRRIGDVLVELGFITERQKIYALAKRLNLKAADIADLSIDDSAVELIPRNMAEKYTILPVRVSLGTLTVLTDDPMNYYGLEDVKQVTGMQLDIILTEKKPLMTAISQYYSEINAHQAAKKANILAVKLTEAETGSTGDDETPIINLLSSLIHRAWTVSASDIHIEPFEDSTLVRMRLDGTIIDYLTLQKSLHNSLIARIKVLSELDIAERRLPQDGHALINIGGTSVNIRVSLIPTVFGEKAVLRILDGNTTIDYSSSFGMRKEDCDRFLSILKSPNGIIYLTGPTGSGKTTTLYMVLEYLSERNLNISTIEDPVEKNIRRINQMQVNNPAGLTFESGLRALLRQDPDIIMVGETRDPETASISVRAAITGHLVFSTLHTNDACSSVIRLIDMGVEPYLLANSVTGIVAQRLMRKVCRNCSVEEEPSEAELELLGTGTVVRKVKKAVGCHLCNNTGYSGRIAIHEILAADAGIRRLISSSATTEKLKNYAIELQGMATLKASAARLVSEGITTTEEFMKVAYGT